MVFGPLASADSAHIRAAWDAFVDAQAEAGADLAFTAEPVNWLAEAEPVTAPPRLPDTPASAAPSAAKVPTVINRADNLPDNHDQFLQWWATSPALDPGPVAERAMPQGAAGAKVMILADQPEAASGGLYDAASDRLLDAILAAAGMARSDVYLGSILPRRTPAPDWDVMAQENLGAVTLAHIALVKPRAIITFGQSSISTLLAPALSKSSGNLRIVNHEGLSIPLVTSLSPHQLLLRPLMKRRAWADWLMLIERLEASCD